MVRAFALAFAVLGCMTGLVAAVPTLSSRISAPPPNGTIELHHDPTTSSWYLLASLDAEEYTATTGNKTIVGQHNPLSTVTIYFTINITFTDGDLYDYTLYATPVAFEHHIDDPLTDVYFYNVKQYCYPEGQPIFTFLSINGVEAPSGGGGDNGQVFGHGFSTDLNMPFNLTGLTSFVTSQYDCPS